MENIRGEVWGASEWTTYQESALFGRCAGNEIWIHAESRLSGRLRTSSTLQKGCLTAPNIEPNLSRTPSGHDYFLEATAMPVGRSVCCPRRSPFPKYQHVCVSYLSTSAFWTVSLETVD